MKRGLLALMLGILGCRKQPPPSNLFLDMHVECFKPGCPAPHTFHTHREWVVDGVSNPFGGPVLP